ncbi:MAG: penicillin acylase family protein [Flavobacteriaceae bacterium]
MLKRFLFYASFSVLLVSLGCTADAEISRLEAISERVEIIRDDFGVPHVYAKTDADAVFGMLYAQCEDDFNRVEQNYIWAIGRLAEVEGPSALYSDVRARMFMTQEEAIKAYEQAPEWLQKLCNSFADGANYYLHTHPEVKPRLLTRFEPWMPFYFSEGSIGGDIERVSTAKIKALYEGDTQIALADDQLVEQPYSPFSLYDEPAGSNGIALNGDMTESGNAMLLINPHTSFFFRGEMHVVSEEGLNAYGAVTWGQFFIYQGFNEKTGWMHTSTYTDVIDEYVETVRNTQTGKEYKYGEKWLAIDSIQETFNVKTDTGLQQHSLTLYRTHHGPITHKVDDQLTATALMWSPAKALEQSFIRTKQSNYEGFNQMMQLKTNSSNNTVYADADKNIAYWHGNFIPVRDTRFDFAQPVDGSDPDTDWKGLHELEEHITLLNPSTQWLQNCNSTPFTAAGPDSPRPEDYPYYMSTAPENFRGVHAISLLEQTQKHTLESLIDLAYDSYLPAFEALIPGLVKSFDETPNPDLTEEIELLRNWDFRTSAESKAMTLAHFYATALYQKAPSLKGYSPMELMQYWGQSADLNALRREVFAEAVGGLRRDFGSSLIEWAEVNRYQRLDASIFQAFNDSLPSVGIGHASGRWGALAAYGARYTNNTKKIYGTRGNSFVAVVEFGERLRAKSLLAGGQSSDVNSRHFDDQVELYAAGLFKEVPFYREDVLKRAIETYRPGKRY